MTATELHARIISKLDEPHHPDASPMVESVRQIAHAILTQWNVKVRAKKETPMATLHVTADVKWYEETLRAIAMNLGVAV